MKAVVKKYIKILTYKNYSERTIETYSCYLDKFLDEVKTNPYHITTKQIFDFLVNKEHSSRSQQNQYIGSLKLFAKYILNKKDVHLNKIERPKKQFKQPRIIDAVSLAEKIKSIENLKHRAILQLGLSCGLRVSEVVNLKWEHLDRKRNIINIIGAKGNKDRSVILNDNMIELLEKYYRKYKSNVYVFNGQKSLQYSSSSIQKLIKKYIDETESYHLLRNSYATYAIDEGTELKPLSVSMGHNSTRTVERFYFHQSQRTLKTIRQVI